MGTSSDYSPPTHDNWRPDKRYLENLPETGSYPASTSKQILRDYIQANGGPRGMAGSGGGTAATSKAGLSIGSNIGGFVSSVSREGIEQTLIDFGMADFVGKSAEEIVYGLIDSLAGEGFTIDDEDAKTALIDLLEDILGEAETAEDVENLFAGLCSEEELSHVLMTYYGYYIFQQLCRVQHAFISAKIGDQKAEHIFSEVKDYIRAELACQISRLAKPPSIIDWNGAEGIRICRQVMENTLYVFWGEEE